VSVETSIQLL